MLQAGAADVKLRLAAGVAAGVGCNTTGRSSKCRIRLTAGVAAEGLMV